MANQKNKTALGAIGAKKAAEKQESNELSEDFEDGVSADGKAAEESPAEAPPAEEPEVRTRKIAAVETRKDQGHKKQPPLVRPTDDFVRDKKGNIRIDEDGDQMRYAAGFHRSVGFVNDAGVRFPPGYKFPGGHIGTFGNVILNRCPKCGSHQSVDEAREGKCGNLRSGVDRRPCGFDMVAQLENISPEDI